MNKKPFVPVDRAEIKKEWLTREDGRIFGMWRLYYWKRYGPQERSHRLLKSFWSFDGAVGYLNRQPLPRPYRL